MVRNTPVDTVVLVCEDEERGFDLDSLLRDCGARAVLTVRDVDALRPVLIGDPPDFAVLAVDAHGAVDRAALDCLTDAKVRVLFVALPDGPVPADAPAGVIPARLEALRHAIDRLPPRANSTPL